MKPTQHLREAIGSVEVLVARMQMVGRCVIDVQDDGVPQPARSRGIQFTTDTHGCEEVVVHKVASIIGVQGDTGRDEVTLMPLDHLRQSVMTTKSRTDGCSRTARAVWPKPNPPTTTSISPGALADG